MNQRFFGVGEPLIQRQRDQGIDAAAALDLVKGLGCNAYRSWMHIPEILKDPFTEKPEEVAEAICKVFEGGVTVEMQTAHARAHAQNTHDPETNYRRLLGIYQTIADAGSRTVMND